MPKPIFRTVPQSRQLAERIKELNCLYSISQLFSRAGVDMRAILEQTANILLSGWEYPEKACARIVLDRLDVHTASYIQTPWMLEHGITVNKKKRGFIRLCYQEMPNGDREEIFLEEEKRLIKAVAELLGSKIEKYQAEETLKKKAAELRKQKRELEYKNAALREILTQIENEKKDIQKKITANVENCVLPIVIRLKNPDINEPLRRDYLDILQKNLSDIVSPFGKSLSDGLNRLSPRELEICNFIRNGLTNKETARLLNISVLTVERHRFNVRKKLGLSQKKINLATYLQRISYDAAPTHSRYPAE